ncbi:hypothetical protein [uncultured Varibaculum sp.]|nr:hypothetical protein [uncultured Varibaculum sp.]
MADIIIARPGVQAGALVFPPAQSSANTYVFPELYAHRAYSDKTNAPAVG